MYVMCGYNVRRKNINVCVRKCVRGECVMEECTCVCACVCGRELCKLMRGYRNAVYVCPAPQKTGKQDSSQGSPDC